jgi:copper homeostasis protein CutC
MQFQHAVDAAKVANEQFGKENERLRIMMEAGINQTEMMLKKEKHDTENYHSAAELAIKAASEDHKKNKELTELQHKIMAVTQ